MVKKGVVLSGNVLCAVFACLLLPVSIALSDIWIGDSLEWTVADSQLIIQGVTIEVAPQGYGHVVTVKVTETLTGEAHDEIIFYTPHIYGTEGPEFWKQQGSEMLFFLVRKDPNKPTHSEAKNCSWVLREASYGGEMSFVRLDGKDQRGMYTMDFAIVVGREELLRAVRDAIAHRESKEPQKETVRVGSSSPLYRKFGYKAALNLVVPVDERLERHARQWAKSEDPLLRWQVPRILRHFRNEGNIEVLTGLLEDPSFQNSAMTDGRIRRVYVIRKDACDLLQEWGIKVTKPTLEEYFQHR